MSQPDGDDLRAEITRLERRLERERSARRQAEAIAEKGLRTLYEKQRLSELLEKVATAANQLTTTDAVLRFAMAQVCEFTGWEVGHCYLTEGYLTEGPAETPRLRSTGIWHGIGGADIDAFRRVSEATEFAPGIGLPGRVLATGKPLWLSDVANEGNFPRLQAALNCGLKGASAFPVLSDREVVAVLEFFVRIAREPDRTLLDVMSQVGLQLGRVIERQRAADRLRERAEELALARDAAKAADKAKSAFLANMSHELRTPLNAIIGYSEMMSEAIALDARYRGYARDINGSGRHLLDIINDVLDISRIEAGRLELRDEPVSIGEAVHACGRVVAPMAEAANVAIVFDLCPSLPDIRSDPVRFKQIVLNLLSNAVKFTPAGGRVGVSARIESNAAVIAVEDSGIGMSEGDVVLAVQPFRQIDAALNRRYEGTGLGLPLAKALVELHGGRLEIQSMPGAGTTVRVILPLERAARRADGGLQSRGLC